MALEILVLEVSDYDDNGRYTEHSTECVSFDIDQLREVVEDQHPGEDIQWDRGFLGYVTATVVGDDGWSSVYVIRPFEILGSE